MIEAGQKHSLTKAPYGKSIKTVANNRLFKVLFI